MRSSVLNNFLTVDLVALVILMVMIYGLILTLCFTQRNAAVGDVMPFSALVR